MDPPHALRAPKAAGDAIESVENLPGFTIAIVQQILQAVRGLVEVQYECVMSDHPGLLDKRKFLQRIAEIGAMLAGCG